MLKPFLQLGHVSNEGEYTPLAMPEMELDVCNYVFTRGVDNQGKIGTDLKGGNISFVSTKMPTIGLLEWGTSSQKYFSGYINFRGEDNKAVRRLYFENAACVNFKISYEYEGQGYFMIQANLQAEILVLEGAKPYRNSWKNHLYMDKIYNRVSEMTQAASDLAKVFQNREVAISASMTLNDANYELRSFEMEFMQEVDSTFGEPKTSSRGGFALVSLFQLPDENINSWLVSPDRAKGEFRFGHEQFGYPLKIGFADAQCAGCFA